ncbi:MAG: glucose-6-phosphate dehydrogenase [Gemmataceae bacterium]
MLARFIILGATGDLTARYLLPAITQLRARELLPLNAIVGVGRDDWDTDQFRRHLADALNRHASDIPAAVRETVVGGLEYRKADVTDVSQLREVIGEPDGPIAVYLALPPAVFEPVLRALAELKLPDDSRIVIEKPFGHDLASARQLNALLGATFPERSVFRIDHFLGMQTVQNVLGLRFANRVFEYLWNRDHIERVEIIWDETVALEGRAGYYDHSGALRDMVQNHLLQLLCLVAMEAPVSFAERDFRDRKVEVLRAVRRFDPDEVKRHAIRARYTAGRIGERDVPSYVDEPGIEPDRLTETFAQVTLFIDNWRWAGVPFRLRTGKALGADRHEIIVHYRPVPHLPFEANAPPANILRLRLDPDRLELGVNINGMDNPFHLRPVALTTELAPQDISAYARLLLDVLDGNAVLSIRGDEAEESWRIVEPILDGWAKGIVPMGEYAAGSSGP